MTGSSGGGEAPVVYEFRVRGHLDDRWANWFDGLDVIRNADGTTTLRGPVVDQAALHGMLERFRDLGTTLLSMQVSD